MSRTFSLQIVVLCAILLGASSPCFADLCDEKEALVTQYGEPDRKPLPAIAGFSDEGNVFTKDELVIHVHFKNGKACSVVYGHKNVGEQLSQTEILLLLNKSSQGNTWQAQTITNKNILNFARSDGKAFASYDGNDVRPCLNVMTKELWNALATMKAAKSKTAGKDKAAAPAAAPRR